MVKIVKMDKKRRNLVYKIGKMVEMHEIGENWVWKWRKLLKKQKIYEMRRNWV